ncbi:MAG TPA: alpha-amylase, partial [Porphyromonadaceae bacterium]|nr:alpha-amylase [Porphyromonadaceae bacterium]
MNRIKHKNIVIYQLLPRLFGNMEGKNVYCGTIKENGCGKMEDVTSVALSSIRSLGCTYIWYTGLIEHATCTDYSKLGIPSSHSDVVKGKAGSPYAIRDYYDIDPDLACKVPNRMKEFENLLKRTHDCDLGFIMDFVPNHLAREYRSDAKPKDIQDFGETDDKKKSFSPMNNFYYLPEQSLSLPFVKMDAKDRYEEYPAKVTGNDCFTAMPSQNDWYETVKLNYGKDYQNPSNTSFSPIPNTWRKMLHILLYWASKGVDGFRCDMAEMIPVEFWHWSIWQVKERYPHILFIAEVYNPALYNSYANYGGFDYLYDKVGLYDTLKSVIQGHQSASAITSCWQRLGNLQQRMLNFLENHDEQRIASDYFAQDAWKGIPMILVSSLLQPSPFMLYFGQELGERGMEQEGFSGKDGRTTIFDYWSVESLKRWNNHGKFDEKLLTPQEKELRSLYKKILSLREKEKCFREGTMYDIMYANYSNEAFDGNKLFAFLRSFKEEVCLVIANFSSEEQRAKVVLPEGAFSFLELKSCDTQKEWKDLLNEQTLFLPFS